jgi:TonB family protein
MKRLILALFVALFLCFGSCTKTTDDEAWTAAKNENTVASYDHYLKMFPQGKGLIEASAKKRFFQDRDYLDQVFLNLGQKYKDIEKLYAGPTDNKGKIAFDRILLLTVNEDASWSDFHDQVALLQAFSSLPPSPPPPPPPPSRPGGLPKAAPLTLIVNTHRYELEDEYALHEHIKMSDNFVTDKMILFQINKKDVAYDQIVDLVTLLRSFGMNEVIPIVTPEIEETVGDRLRIIGQGRQAQLPGNPSWWADFRQAMFKVAEEDKLARPGTEGGIEGGVEGGIIGGLEGGVLGGIAGGVPGGVTGSNIADFPAVRAGGDIKPPKLIKDVAPNYPEIARQAGVEGVVILEVETDIFGSVKSVKILRSIPLLDQAAVDAVRKRVYEMANIDGVPRGVIFNVTVKFKL